MSRVATERRLLAQRRASLARMEAAGIDPSRAQQAMQAAFVVWSHRWRWLPESLRSIAFDVLGRRMAARYVQKWHADA